MTIYQTVIVENNADNSAILRKIITENHPELNIVADAHTVATAKEILIKHKPHIALMAIEIEDGTSFDALTDFIEIQDICFEIIFISTHPNYDFAVKAMKFASLALLSKPIDLKILRGAIEKAKLKLTQKRQVEQLIAKLKTLEEQSNQITIPITNNLSQSVFIAHITFFEAQGQTTIVHLHDNTSIVSFRNLGYYKKILLLKKSFSLIHSRFLVNIEQIKSFKYKELEIIMKNGCVLKPSRRLGKDFKKYWNERL